MKYILEYKHWIITAAFIIMALVIFRLCESNRDLRYDLDNVLPSHTVDTVYKSKPYVPIKLYDLPQLPNKVIFYKPPIILPIEKVIVRTDTVRIYLKDSTVIDYNNRFLTSYPNSPKILGLELNDRKMSIDLLSTSGDTYSQQYKINTNKYQYRFDGTSLTYEKKPFIKRFNISASYQFRPLNNLHDIDLGIKYNTSKFNYVMGINGFYYPRYKNNPGWDIYFRVEYNF